MEHIAHTLNKDPLGVREINFIEPGDQLLPVMMGEKNFDSENLIPLLIDEMKKSGDYELRKAAIEKFNAV